MKKSCFTAFIVSVFLVIGLQNCGKKQKSQALAPNNATLKTAEKVKVPFAPPPYNLITTSQMKTWLSCNPRLDSLSYVYKDSFQVKDSEALLRYQISFLKAQDHICLQQGLSGGYEEYSWVSRNCGNTKNKPVMDSLGIKNF
jgi:hypothetical protein